ncbi:hypothetical protein [Actinomadura monticuli]|uniref:Helix-turn-helix domain-containing protein n=1 Tax=Actinomadura monticuli TaxID=3097367 RepID=A0ABV4Q611_9ACTN
MTNNAVEIDTIAICYDVFHAHLSPTARLLLIYAMNNRDARTVGINSKTAGKWLQITRYAAEKALKELRACGLAEFRVANRKGQLHHEWTFRWPTIDEASELRRGPVKK